MVSLHAFWKQSEILLIQLVRKSDSASNSAAFNCGAVSGEISGRRGVSPGRNFRAGWGVLYFSQICHNANAGVAPIGYHCVQIHNVLRPQIQDRFDTQFGRDT